MVASHVVARAQHAGDLPGRIADHDAAPDDLAAHATATEHIVLAVVRSVVRMDEHLIEFINRTTAVLGGHDGIEPVMAQKGVFVATEDLAALAVDQRDLAVGAQRHQDGLCRLQVAIGAIALQLQRHHRLASHADVLQEADESRRFRTGDASHRQEHREDAAVAAPRFHLATDADDLGHAGLQVAFQVGVVPWRVGAGHQHADVPTEHIGGAVAEHAFSGAVETFDEAARADDDDPVQAGIEHSLEFRCRSVLWTHRHMTHRTT
jgi:hypothetical protein